MARSVVSYDKDLPEIPDRAPHLEPDSHLRKKAGSTDEFEIVEGRRPSRLLLVNKLRASVGEWRRGGYPGASEVSKSLFNYWFEEDHLINGGSFRYYFGQREAVETIVYLVEVEKGRDLKTLVNRFGEIFYPEGTQIRMGEGLVHQTTMDGKRQIRRYIPEVEGDIIQDLPPENLSRYAFKMATGSGKTTVIAMAMVWSYFHKRIIPGSDLSTNFLLIAPNVIVYQRLEKDFASNRIFHDFPLIPPEWRGQWNLKVIMRGEGTEADPSGNLFLTNIHQIYESRRQDWTPANAVDALLGRRPVKDLSSYERPMLDRIMGLKDLVVINDEAHHVHEEELAWHKTLTSIHEGLPSGLALWLDFSATPKDQNGTYFPWVICDYPLAQAVEDRIVKAPLIVHQVRRADPDIVTRKNVIEAYGDWLIAAFERWREHYTTYKELGKKPVLFIMAEQNNLADEIGEWLRANEDMRLKEKEVLIIHTDSEGEITKTHLKEAREAARDIDKPGSRIKVIVSVLMLREGWDVRNVTVVLGLRPFTSKAHILPEQAVGRGLRLMQGISPDSTQTLEVMGTKKFEDFVRELEKEGVGIKTVTKPPKPPVRIEPVLEKADYDISIPLTELIYTHNYKRLSDLDPLSLAPIYDQEELDEPIRIRIKMDFAMTDTEVHQTDIAIGPPPLSQEIIASITNKAIDKARLTGIFDELYPIVKAYVKQRCFGRSVDLDNQNVRSHLRSALLQEGIAKYLARKIGELTSEKRPIEIKEKDFRLSDTTPFSWRRNLPLIACSKTIFNLAATYNDFEKSFAAFLEGAGDITRFASLGNTEQESGTRFKVDYLKPSGAIGFYYPDWVAVQETDVGEVHWIIETKGRVWEGTLAKDEAIAYWCKKVGEQTGIRWRYVRINQADFERKQWESFGELGDFAMKMYFHGKL
ncbi:DEAD/DEAH box helicase family protein [bacterium]|nr:DEAD/DEAH box helicase family protein [bacterium]